MIQVLTFYLFAGIMIAAGAFTILARNPVHSVLWLSVTLLATAALAAIHDAGAVHTVSVAHQWLLSMPCRQRDPGA